MPRTPWEQLELGARPAPDARAANDVDVDLSAAFEGAHVVPGARRSTTSAHGREQGGKKAQSVGENFEGRLRALLEGARLSRRLVWWTKIETPTKQVRLPRPVNGERYKIVWGEKAAADFMAVTEGGCPVVIECKSVQGTRLPQAAIQPQQRTQLDAVAAAGGLALLAVEFRTEGKVIHHARQYLVPWRTVPWEKARTAWSLTETACVPWVIRQGTLLEHIREAEAIFSPDWFCTLASLVMLLGDVRQVAMVMRVIAQLVVHGPLPEPRVDLCEGELRFTWDAHGRRLDLTVLPGGRLVWFASKGSTGRGGESAELEAPTELLRLTGAFRP